MVKERRLPGFGEWGRVVDYREYQIGQMANVNVYLESEMSSDTLTEFEDHHIVVATGPNGPMMELDAKILWVKE